MLMTELEILTGKLIRGDITPIVFDLIKDSHFINDIFELTLDNGECDKNASKEEVSRVTNNDCGIGPDFQEWFSNSVQPVTISRDVRREAKGKGSIGQFKRSHSRENHKGER